MQNDYDETAFVFGLPLWFVVAEPATRIAPEGHRELVDRRGGAFCGGMVGGKRCLLIFTDEDLAERHARTEPGCVPLGCNNLPVMIDLLNEYYPDEYHSVIVDIVREKPWTNRRIAIPEFIEALENPSE